MLLRFVILATIFFVKAEGRQMLRGRESVIPLTKARAEKACSIFKDAQYRKMCDHDVLASQDMNVVNIYRAIEKREKLK
jgi:regulator of sigma D